MVVLFVPSEATLISTYSSQTEEFYLLHLLYGTLNINIFKKLLRSLYSLHVAICRQFSYIKIGGNSVRYRLIHEIHVIRSNKL